MPRRRLRVGRVEYLNQTGIKCQVDRVADRPSAGAKRLNLLAKSHTFELGFSCWHSNFAGSAYALWFGFASIELRS